MKTSLFGLCLFALSATACGGSNVPAENAEYPELDVTTSVMELSIEDPRKEIMERLDQPSETYQNDFVSVPQPFPSPFEQQAIERLSRITGKGGLPLRVTVIVQRADVTFSNDFRGNLTRYDVALQIRVTTEKGTLLEKGKGQTFQELPNEEATKEEMQRIFLSTALNAFDQYFAEEESIEKINSQIEAYLKAHPDERR